MLRGRHIIDDICVLDTVYLIPFKMYAWINLSDRKERGEHVNEKDLRKHKYDVFRLLEIVPRNQMITTHGNVKESIRQFTERITAEPINLSDADISIDLENALRVIRSIYN